MAGRRRSRSGGSARRGRHRIANLQRRAKRQPGGGSSRLGTVPGICSSRALRPAPRVDARDRADQPLRVGMARIGEQRLDRRLLDHLAGIHHHDALRVLGDHAHGVGDQHDRHAEPRLHLGQQLEDLRLDRDVERGGRLVGDQQLRACRPAPWRSSRAGACRRRTGADSRARGAAAFGICTSRSISTARVHRRPARQPCVRAQRLGDLLADRVDRVERGHRLLEHHADLARADLVHLRRRRAGSGRGPATGSGRPRSGPAACRSASARCAP